MTGSQPIHLDLGTPQHSGFEAPAHDGFEGRPGNGQSAYPDASPDRQLQKDAARLQELIGAGGTASHQVPSRPAPRDDPPDERNAATMQPFDLFGGSMPTSAEPVPAIESPEMAGLEESLALMARTLLVGESPRGGDTVRMELTTENLPGVVLEVFRDQGAVVAQFTCANEHSRTRLARAVPWLGESLSHRLSRDTLVRVLTDDPEDPSPVEARHQATPD